MNFLIPHAVGYSAGLINYFFRGKINLVRDAFNPTQYRIENHGTELLKGVFTLYYDDTEGNRHAAVPVPNTSNTPTQWSTPEDGLAPGQSMSVPSFPPRQFPGPKTPGEYMLVFQGDMGAEIGTAVAATLVNDDGCPVEFMTPTGRLSRINGAWRFTSDLTVQYGNTDWVGRDCTRLSWLGPYGRHVHMRHTSALSNKIFSAGQVFATAPGPVLGAAIQTNPFTGERILLAVVAEVPEGGDVVIPGSPDTSGQVSADKLYGLSLNNPTAWFILSTFDQYTMDSESNLPAQTAYPAHYFFNASGTQAVSVKRIAGEEVDKSPWRVLMLDVNAQTGAAEFTLEAVETIGTPQYSNTGTDSPNGATSYSYRNTYDLSYVAPAVAADYQGNRLVTVRLHVEEHSVEAGSGSGDPNTSRSGIYTLNTTRQWTLETNTGWTHTVINDVSTIHNSSVSGPASCECGSHRSERHTNKMQHGLVYVDLRFQSPVLAYEVFQGDYDTILESDTPPGGPVQIVQDLDTVQEKEQLIWLIADQEESVTGLRTITLEAPAKFVLPNQAPVAFAEGGREVGTFVAGGSLQRLKVIAAHKYPDGIDTNGQLEFGFASNFMFPSGDLNAYGGGPVGY